MMQEFDPIAEIRKHPGITGAVVAVLAGVGLATVLLNQRGGPISLDRLRTYFEPEPEPEAPLGLRGRVDHFTRSMRGRIEDAGERAGDFSDEARDRADRWYRDARKVSKRTLKRHRKTAQRYAGQAGDYAKDHAREGGAILAIVTIAAAIGAAALESRKSGKTGGSGRY